MTLRVRPLRVTDLRCLTPGCRAGPGEGCITGEGRQVPPHDSRIAEHRDLVADNWEWQENDPRDDGKSRNA